MTESRPRSVAVRWTSMVPWMRRPATSARLAVDAARDLAELAVEEDPVVELAAPSMEVVVADEPTEPAGMPPGTTGPSTAIRQRRARAPSMTSTPRSSAVAR